MLLIIYFFISFLRCINSELFLLQYVILGDSYESLFKVSGSNTSLIAIPNISSNITWFSDDVFSQNLSFFKVIEEQKIKIEDDFYNAFEIEASLEASKMVVKNFRFFYPPSPPGILLDSLGLAFKFSDIKYSLIHQLKLQGIIDKLQFGISKLLFEDDGILYIGGMFNSILVNYERATCKINPNYITWGCNLNYFYINDNVSIGYQISDYSYFTTETSKIIVPEHFFEYLKKNIFHKYLEEKVCNIEEKYVTNVKFNCKCSSINDFPTFTFVIDNIKFEFIKFHLFDSIGANCNFLIQTNKNKTNGNNVWILGTQFFNQYYTLYDYENETVTFFQDDEFSFIDISSYLSSKYYAHRLSLFIILMIIMALTIIELIYTRIKFNY